MVLETFIKHPYFDKGDELVKLYENFIKDFEKKMNQLTLVKLMLITMRQIQDLSAAANFLQKLSEKMNPAIDKEALALCLNELAWLKLKLNQLEECKQLTEKAASILEGMTGADHLVYSSHYKVLSMYYKIKVAPTEFYRNSLLYLVYTPLETISKSDQQTLAFDMGLAALVSTEIHNFGELLAQPILSSLEGTPGEWLKHFLFAFNSGDIDKFNQFLTSHKLDIEKQPALKSNFPLLREKIGILSVMELMFARPSESRVLPFEEIANAAKIPTTEVELLVMKALSLKLIKGVIDEVHQTVSVDWVQPRVLDWNQIKKMKTRMDQWIDNVQQLLNFMQNSTAPELLT